MKRINQTSLDLLTPEQVAEIRQTWANRPTPRARILKEIGARFGRSPHSIRNIIRRKNYRYE